MEFGFTQDSGGRRCVAAGGEGFGPIGHNMLKAMAVSATREWSRTTIAPLGWWSSHVSKSELGVAGSSGERDDIADILHSCAELDDPLESKPKSGMGDGTKTT